MGVTTCRVSSKKIGMPRAGAFELLAEKAAHFEPFSGECLRGIGGMATCKGSEVVEQLRLFLPHSR
jgi:hypothetical protein